MIFGLILSVVVSAVLAVVAGLLIMLVGKLLFKDAPEFGDAWKSAFFALLTLTVINFISNMAITATGSEGVALVIGLLGIPISFAVYVYFLMQQVGYTLGQAAAVVGVIYGIFIALGVALVAAGMGAMLFGASAAAFLVV